MDSGNIGFVLLCAAFVFVMTPGLAMFYGGLVRKKNVVNTMMTSIFIIGVGIVMWVLFGYSLSFAPSGNAFIGDFRWRGLEGVSLPEGYTDDASIPNMVFSAFQMMFADPPDETRQNGRNRCAADLRRSGGELRYVDARSRMDTHTDRMDYRRVPATRKTGK